MTDVDAATQAERLTALLSLTPDDEHLGEPIPLSDVPLAFAVSLQMMRKEENKKKKNRPSTFVSSSAHSQKPRSTRRSGSTGHCWAGEPRCGPSAPFRRLCVAQVLLCGCASVCFTNDLTLLSSSLRFSPSALRVESQSSFCSVRANAVVFGSRWQYEVTLESCVSVCV